MYLLLLSSSVMSYSFATQLARFFCPWDIPGKNTRVTSVGCHFLLQGIFLDLLQGLNLCLLYWQADSLPLSHQGSPIYVFILPLRKQSINPHSLSMGYIFFQKTQYEKKNNNNTVWEGTTTTTKPVILQGKSLTNITSSQVIKVNISSDKVN